MPGSAGPSTRSFLRTTLSDGWPFLSSSDSPAPSSWPVEAPSHDGDRVRQVPLFFSLRPLQVRWGHLTRPSQWHKRGSLLRVSRERVPPWWETWRESLSSSLGLPSFALGLVLWCMALQQPFYDQEGEAKNCRKANPKAFWGAVSMLELSSFWFFVKWEKQISYCLFIFKF